LAAGTASFLVTETDLAASLKAQRHAAIGGNAADPEGWRPPTCLPPDAS
jgi:hypothetical protein